MLKDKLSKFVPRELEIRNFQQAMQAMLFEREGVLKE